MAKSPGACACWSKDCAGSRRVPDPIRRPDRALKTLPEPRTEPSRSRRRSAARSSSIGRSPSPPASPRRQDPVLFDRRSAPLTHPREPARIRAWASKLLERNLTFSWTQWRWRSRANRVLTEGRFASREEMTVAARVHAAPAAQCDSVRARGGEAGRRSASGCASKLPNRREHALR